MQGPSSNPRLERIEKATSRRLAQLKAMPIDTRALAAAIQAKIPRPSARAAGWKIAWFQPMRAAAASLLVIGLVVAVVLHWSGGPVLASADALAVLHQAVVAKSANGAMALKCPGQPDLPMMPANCAMSCCVQRLGRKQVPCASFMVDGTPVSIVAANASDVRMPRCQSIESGGARFDVQSQGGINMVMAQRGPRWFCVMGKLSTDKLIAVSQELKF